VIAGDARATLPDWDGRADAWFLDGFAPARNPALWEPALMIAVARHTAPGGSCASFTAAGHVRRALAAAGFAVDRRPGFGRKRHMTVGLLR
jgi:tRNA U34 5-methylaminomethyl-2-thiouridine-forming methyltransferase MnmC